MQLTARVANKDSFLIQVVILVNRIVGREHMVLQVIGHVSPALETVQPARIKKHCV